MEDAQLDLWTRQACRTVSEQGCFVSCELILGEIHRRHGGAAAARVRGQGCAALRHVLKIQLLVDQAVAAYRALHTDAFGLSGFAVFSLRDLDEDVCRVLSHHNAEPLERAAAARDPDEISLEEQGAPDEAIARFAQFGMGDLALHPLVRPLFPMPRVPAVRLGGADVLSVLVSHLGRAPRTADGVDLAAFSRQLCDEHGVHSVLDLGVALFGDHAGRTLRREAHMVAQVLQLQEKRHAEWLKGQLAALNSAGGPERPAAATGEAGAASSGPPAPLPRLQVRPPTKARSLALGFLQEMQRRSEERGPFAPSFSKMREMVERGGWGGSKRAYTEIATDYAMLHLGPSLYRRKRIVPKAEAEEASSEASGVASGEELADGGSADGGSVDGDSGDGGNEGDGADGGAAEVPAEEGRDGAETGEAAAGAASPGAAGARRKRQREGGADDGDGRWVEVRQRRGLAGAQAASEHRVAMGAAGSGGTCTWEPAHLFVPWVQPLDPQDRAAVGRFGEALVHQLLVAECGTSGATAEWLNEAEETKAPYDLTLDEPIAGGAATKRTFVEVKTTAAGRNCFELSLQEWDFIRRGVNGGGGDNYRIYRVYLDAADASKAAVLRVDDVHGALLARDAKLCLALPPPGGAHA